MLPIASPLLVANALALLDLSRVLQDGLIGAGIGTIISKVVVQRQERVGNEWRPQRIRQVELAWVGSIGFVFLIVGIVLR